MSMIRKSMRAIILPLSSALLLASAPPALAASSEADFKAAYAAAEAANKQAGALRDRWTVTVTALSDARKAADSGDFDRAVASSQEAEALAKASIFQATNEKDTNAWKALEIR